MANTRQQIRALCRRRLGDLDVPYHWSDLQVNQWINDAIADYSLHFPLISQLSLATVAGQNHYPLTGIRRILGVEYPLSAAGPALENPLRQLEHTCPEFLAQAGYYDVVYSPAAGSEVELWLSGVIAGCPAALAADCRCACQADHSYLDDDSDATSLPERHLELVMLYVRWAAFQELASSESANPDPTSLAMSTLELNAYRAQRLYLAALQEVKHAESESRLVCWKLDLYDRIH